MTENRYSYSKILKLGFPILIGQLGNIMVGFADTNMVGQYSTEALASASFVNNLFNVSIFACVGFTYGLTPLIGALFSQKRDKDIGSLLRTGLWVNGLFALLITAIMGAVYVNIEKFDLPDELLPIIRPYFLIYLAGVLPIAFFNVLAQWAYTIQRTVMPMVIILIANCVNIAGNWLLIRGNMGCPELGLTGAGLASLAARWLCVLMIGGVFLSRNIFAGYRQGFFHAPRRKGDVKLLNVTSWPVAMQMAFESGSFTAAAIMAGWLGKIPLAAFQVIVIVGTLGFCIYYSMAAAVSVLVSNAAGKGDRRLMRSVAGKGYVIILILATCSSLLFIFAGSDVIRFFSHDSEVISVAVSLIVPLVLYQYGDATQINYANALRGTANVMPMLWIAFVSYVVVGVPATYLLAFPAGLGIYGIILSFSISLFLAAGLFLWFFMRSTRS